MTTPTKGPEWEDQEKLDKDLRDLGYDPAVIGKKGDALARLCYQNQLNRAIIDAQKKQLDYCVQILTRKQVVKGC